MTAKKLKHLLLGSLSLALGAWLAVQTIRVDLVLFRTQRFGWWDFSDAGLRFAIAVYFIWLGARTIQRAGEELTGPRIGWGKLLLGSTLIYGSIKAHFVPQRFWAHSQPQTSGIDGVSITMFLIGAAFILAAFVKKQSSAETGQQPSNS